MRAKERVDYIFCDPPFPYAHKWDLLARIAASPLMDGSTLLMLHRPRQDFCDDVEERCGLISQRKSEYGRSIVEYFTKKAPEKVPGTI
jgi:16S rRNA G966 N2-methylase RsmD